MAKRGNGEGSIYRRRDGRWVGVVHLGYENGKRKRQSVYGRSQREVRDAMNAAQARRSTGDTLARHMTAGAFLVSWLEEVAHPKVRPSTYKCCRSLTITHIIPAIGHIQMEK